MFDEMCYNILKDIVRYVVLGCIELNVSCEVVVKNISIN